MSRTTKMALSVLAGMAFGAGALLYLAAAADRLPGVEVLIALGAVLLAGCLPMLLALDSRRSSAGRCHDRDHDPA